jgi:acetoacetyl-CoA synthetase
VNRFGQIRPAVLLAADTYRYHGRVIDRRGVVEQVVRDLPDLGAVVRVPSPGAGAAPPTGATRSVEWADLLATGEATLEPAWVAFDHPLWVVYSSGTTGLPKPIVHGHGGIVLEQLKWLALHTDLGRADRFFWFTTTGWIMWNAVVGGLLAGAAIVLYDGDPTYPDLSRLWRLAQETGITAFGASPPFFDACRRAGLRPGDAKDLSALRTIGSTGAPLSEDGFRWLYDAVHPDVHVGSASGGTDIASAFVGPCPLLPVHAGEIQCRFLGARVEAYDPQGRPLVDEVGELVVTRPLPSMPLRFWGDEDGERYRDSYFTQYPGVWRHGDWLRITPRGSAVISGRSDATLNRSGVRLGSSEFYSVLERMPEVLDSLVVDVPGPEGQGSDLVLFLVLADGRTLDNALGLAVRDQLCQELSPRHVPDRIHAVAEIPRTLNGKKLEVPVKRILSGESPEDVVSASALSNPSSLDAIVLLARAADHRH